MLDKIMQQNWHCKNSVRENQRIKTQEKIEVNGYRIKANLKASVG